MYMNEGKGNLPFPTSFIGTLKVGVTPSLGHVRERDLEVGLGLR